jgi:hypothetical protein
MLGRADRREEAPMRTDALRHLIRGAVLLTLLSGVLLPGAVHAQQPTPRPGQTAANPKGNARQPRGPVPAQPPAGVTCQGNAIYIVCVNTAAPLDIGRYTALTGPGHPTPGRNLLFGGEEEAPGTTFNSYRSFTSSTTYTQGAVTGATNLNSVASTSLIGTTGVRTTYNITTPDRLQIVQDANVNGMTVANANVEIATTITNTGTAPVSLGIRYLWDYQMGQDDGPTFQEMGPTGPVRTTEFELTGPTFQDYQIVNNDFCNPSCPLYLIFGTDTGPPTLVPPPTAPTNLAYACWPDVFATAFDYNVIPGRDIATLASPCGGSSGGDSSVVYWWGRSAAQGAITLAPGQSVTRRALVFVPQTQPATPTATATATATRTPTPAPTGTATPTPIPIRTATPQPPAPVAGPFLPPPYMPLPPPPPMAPLLPPRPPVAMAPPMRPPGQQPTMAEVPVIPEAENWGLVLIGLGALGALAGWRMRRRRAG